MKVNWFHCNPALFWLSCTEELMNVARIPAIASPVASFFAYSSQASIAFSNMNLQSEILAKQHSMHRTVH